MNNYWKDDEKIEKLCKNYFEVDLNERAISLCLFAENLTLNPSELNEPRIIENLKKAGLSDAAILDATLVVSYFNFVNRMVLALGVSIEEDGGTGYKY